MKELWLEVLEWIQLGVTLVFMVFMLGVLGLVVRYHRLEFNGLWKTRAAMAWIAFMWGLSLLLGRHHLWATERISFIENNSTIIENNNSTISNNQSTLSDYSNNNGMVYYNASHYRIVEEGGAIGTSESNVEGLCRAHVFLTYGIFMPAFFLIILVILREKERTKLQLYSIDPNLHVLVRVLPWVVPPLICHIVILALSGVSSSGSSVVWATYRSDHRHCVVPVLSTAPFAVFYSFFLFFYWGTSRRLFTRLINRTIRMRVWTTQLFFFAVFPLEIVLRFISIFISKYNDAFESVYHTYYFLQLIICTIAIVELVLLPVLDAIRFPLMAGVTATACQEYHKSEEERKKRRYTRSHAALQRVMSEDEMEKGNVKNNNNNNNNNNVKNNNNNNNVKNNNSNMISSSSSSSSPNKGNKIEMEPLQKKSSTTSLSPSSNKPLLVSSGSNDSIDDDHDLHDSRPSSAVNTFSNLANLTLTTTKAGDFPEALDVDDVFANMDDEVDAVEDSSLKLKVDGIFLPDPELQ